MENLFSRKMTPVAKRTKRRPIMLTRTASPSFVAYWGKWVVKEVGKQSRARSQDKFNLVTV